ncbi:ABC transporter ATP-binding protein [Haloarcula hispanica]|uniref:ABC transporter ATP-binding protein n=1 Tax=Haloarcula hispanica TaxID=51589 RepID=A0A482T247_HALHI|nr:ABC transporter ATP-binding protein [Haloarcula hispanica]MCJ0618638.1 ABC transporter ATP-binding protein [Haloarcula hispanica]RYJ09206.1 ABC transporter ATP-binding protein [Haloarcula hispanica]
MTDTPSVSEKYASLRRVALYRPALTGSIVAASLFVMLLEGVGLSFLFPILDAAQGGQGLPLQADGVTGQFLSAYAAAGLPLTLESLLLGLACVMVVRFTASFAVKWLAAKLTQTYERDLKNRAYELAMGASVAYYDDKGSDDIMNTILTQTRYAGRVIGRIIQFFQQAILCLVYIGIALAIAPVLAVGAAVALGGVTAIIRYGIEPGYAVGDRVATANEQLQETTQAGTQGIRDVKLFGMRDGLLAEFRATLDRYTSTSIAVRRNEVAIGSFYRLSVSLLLFGLVYVAISFRALSIAELGVFLFAMLRLAPRLSSLNSTIYAVEGELPHLVRTHQFIDRLETQQEPTGGQPVPDCIEEVAFENVSFAYEDEPVLADFSMAVERGEFVGIVGESGGGKSTVVSLLTRLYAPDSGDVLANGTPISTYALDEWRDAVAMVRQDPHIFNDSLRYNLTVGRDISDETLYEVAEKALVLEFLDDLPQGLDTVLGDDGVKLSGGQRQRVALARALLTDAEILVLDEATSDLDSNLERQIHRTVETLDGDQTVIAIAHRLSTVSNADRIYTVADGQVTERGSHAELLDDGGTYAELYAMQGTAAAESSSG